MTSSKTLTPTLRRWGIRLGIPVLALLAVLTAGPFVYIHFVQGKAPAPLTLPALSGSTSTTAATAGTAGTAASGSAAGSGSSSVSTISSSELDGTWTIVSGSQAGYRVKENLFGQNTEAVGRTSHIAGDFVLDGTTVRSGTITVDLTTLASDESRRDGQVQGRILNTSRYPKATFTLTKAIDLTNLPANGVVTTVTATGDLALHGVTRTVDAKLSAQRSGETIQVSGTIPVTFSDYGISSPSTAGITVQDSGVIEFLLLFSQT